jgi:uncharacterized membrane protein
MKIGRYNIHVHSISVHFTNALYPVALFFLILSHFYQEDASLFTYFHLMILATFSAPISYITGIIEWKQKYKGAKVRIFTRKKRLGLVLLGLGITCSLWYGCHHDVLNNVGGLRIVFLFLNFAILPNVIYLGYLGGKLVFGGGH